MRLETNTPSTRRVSRLLITLFAIAACGGEPSAAELRARAEREIPKAQAAVERFFAAIDARDCDALDSVHVRALTAEDCDNLLTDFVQRDVRFLRFEGATVDGRDPNAVLVSAIVWFEAGEHKWIVRAEKRDGAWRVYF